MAEDDTGTYRDFLNDFQPGVFLGTRYKILKMIGSGGMGRVFMTRDLELDLDVALKVIRPELLQSEKALERLKNELILARRVSHRNVVRIHDIGEIRGLKYLTMTYIAGKSLREVLRQAGPMDIARAIRIFTQICEGVAAAHEEGVLHRDLKPANVMLDETDRVYLTDFGIAKWLDAPDETATGVLIGTPAYLSPEQTWGERPDARSDIYALGLILYELLTSALPFDQQKAAAFKTRLPSDLPKKLKQAQPEIPRYLISVVQRCLDPDKNARYQTVKAILRDIQTKTVASGIPIRRIAVLAACAALIAFASLGISRMFHRDSIKTPSKISLPESPAILRSAVVLPFRNKTGNQQLSWFSTTFSDLLISDLSELRNFRMIGSDRVFQLIKDLKLDPATFNDESAKQVAELLDANLLIDGSFTNVGSTYRADVDVSDRSNPAKNFHLQATVNRQEDLLAMIDQISQQIDQKLQREQKQVPVHRTRPSLAAVKLFQEGLQKMRADDSNGAIASFQQCIQTDPNYGEAYLNLSRAYSQHGEDDQASAVLQRAVENRVSGSDKILASIQAEYEMMRGDFKKAAELYERLSRNHPQDPELFASLANVYEQAGEMNQAVSALHKIIQIDPNDAEAYFKLGKVTILAGNPDQAISQYLIKALSIQTQVQNKQGQADVLNAMGVAYERLGRYDDALKYYQDSLALKEEIGNKKSATTSLTNIAKIYIFQSQFLKAQAILNRALSVYEDLKDQAGVADVQNTFGVINENQGRYAEALKYYKNALQVRKELGDNRLTALSYDNIGQIYYLMANYDEAQAFTEQGLSLRQKIGDQNGIILSLQSLGFLELAQGALDRALKFFIDALNQARTIKFENAIAVSLGNMGTIYQAQGRYGAALASYSEAIDVLKKLNDKKGQAEYTKLMGKTYLEMGVYESARTQFATAKGLAGEIGSDELLTDVAILSSRIDRLQGYSEKARNEIAAAENLGTKDEYAKGLLQAKIEKGLLTQSDSLLKSVYDEATGMHDFWLQMDSQYALALLYLKNEKTTQSIKVCETAIPVANKFGIAPYLYRFHSIEAQAYAKQSNGAKAQAHFQQAATYIENIRKDLKDEQISAFLKLPEVEAVNQ